MASISRSCCCGLLRYSILAPFARGHAKSELPLAGVTVGRQSIGRNGHEPSRSPSLMCFLPGGVCPTAMHARLCPPRSASVSHRHLYASRRGGGRNNDICELTQDPRLAVVRSLQKQSRVDFCLRGVRISITHIPPDLGVLTASPLPSSVSSVGSAVSSALCHCERAFSRQAAANPASRSKVTEAWTSVPAMGHVWRRRTNLLRCGSMAFRTRLQRPKFEDLGPRGLSEFLWCMVAFGQREPGRRPPLWTGIALVAPVCRTCGEDRP